MPPPPLAPPTYQITETDKTQNENDKNEKDAGKENDEYEYDDEYVGCGF